MSTSPAPQVSRGDLTLQPSYFTSSLFVYPLREDITNLIQTYSTRYFQSDRSQPFALFKSIWNEQGWTWLHLRVFDARAREKFLDVVFRLFIGVYRSFRNELLVLPDLGYVRTIYFNKPSDRKGCGSVWNLYVLFLATLHLWALLILAQTYPHTTR